MKTKVVSFLVLFFICLSHVYGQNDVAVVSVKWERPVMGGVPNLRLYKMHDGNLLEIASSAMSVDNMYYFACMPQPEGFYYIGVTPLPSNRFPIYLKQGDRLNMTVTTDSWHFNGNVSAENSELRKWYEFIQPIEDKAIYFLRVNSTFRDFFPLLEEKVEAFKTYPESRTGNRVFDRKFEIYKSTDLNSLIFAYMFTPRREHPTVEDFPDFFRNINVSDFVQTTQLMDYPGGLNLVDRIISVKGRAEGASSSSASRNILENLDELIANDTIKGELVLRMAVQRRTYIGLLDYKGTYGKYLITERQQKQFAEMLNTLSEIRDGGEAIDFRFPDVNGKETALSDFVGKVVYIDVWATWCGPCKQELPFFKQLEEEYRNDPNVVFLSVSVDSQRDYEKWKTFIAEENMQGVQLFAGDKARDELMTPYRISGIPRFMLVGKDGNLVAIDAPRPSSPEIRTVLRALLTN